MKKIYLLVVCCLFLVSAPLHALNAEADPKANIFPAKKVKPLFRPTKDPLVILLLDRPYFLAQTTPNDDEDGWDNLYLPAGKSEKDNDAILISNVEKTTCNDVLEESTDDLDDLLSLDSRNPKDQMLSSLSEEDGDALYRVGRVVQQGDDVFYIVVMLPRSAVAEGDWEQLQKNIYAAVRNTPKSVLTDNFVQSVCKFGSDCRAQ